MFDSHAALTTQSTYAFVDKWSVAVGTCHTTGLEKLFVHAIVWSQERETIVSCSVCILHVMVDIVVFHRFAVNGVDVSTEEIPLQSKAFIVTTHNNNHIVKDVHIRIHLNANSKFFFIKVI